MKTLCRRQYKGRKYRLVVAPRTATLFRACHNCALGYPKGEEGYLCPHELKIGAKGCLSGGDMLKKFYIRVQERPQKPSNSLF